ncbi:MAG: hybrid sensor histidine kinase/response regulator [Holophaga sp.]|nr:hybrid sensor histidine kinase/response regulator [Holophaga sp.]
MSEKVSGERPRIMIVDDHPENLQLLKRMLTDCGWGVVAFPDGAMALKAAGRHAPDLVLLDIRMPGMDGYQVCRAMKQNPRTRSVPVIFLSALNAAEDKVTAFQNGGEDFITKPFHFEEVKARVDAHLKLHRYRTELEAKNRALEDNYRKLREMASMRDTLVHMVVHDMRNVVQTVMMVQEVVRRMGPEQFGREGPQVLQDAVASTFLLREMISTVLDQSKLEAGVMELKMKPCDLREVARDALEPMRTLQGQGLLVLDLPQDAVPAVCDPPIVGRIILNLVSNAVKFTPPKAGAIRLGIRVTDAGVRVAVRDQGPGIAPEYLDRIFDPYNQGPGTGPERYPSTGLGLTFAKMAVEAHGGRIGVESEVGRGSTFWFVLPRR